MSVVGERLADAIRARGISATWLGAKSGIPMETITRITRGETACPRLDTLQALAPVLHVSVAWLIGEPTAQLAPHEVRLIRDALRLLRRLEDVV